MNTILGGQFSSRINSNLREDKGFTYGAHSFFSYNKACGKFNVSTSVNSENTLEAVNEIIKELNGIRTEIRKDELEFAKSYLIKRYPANFETFSQIAKNVSMLNHFGLPKDYFNMYIRKIEEVSLDNVTKAALKNVSPDRLTILIVGNEKLLAQKLKILGSEINIIDSEGNSIN
jgi:predicted Zn-dependent peptidase